MNTKLETGIQRAVRERRELVELLKQCYVSGHREAWQDGPTTDEVMNAVNAWMSKNVSDHWKENLPKLETPHLMPLDRLMDKACEKLPDGHQIVIRAEEGWADIQLEDSDSGEVLAVRRDEETFDDAFARMIK